MNNPLEAIRQNLESVAGLAVQAMAQYGILKVNGPWRYSTGPLLSLRSSEKVPVTAGSTMGYGNIWMAADMVHGDSNIQNHALAEVKKFIAIVLTGAGYYDVRSSWKPSDFQRATETYKLVVITVSFKVKAEVPCNYRLEWAGV